MTRNVINIDEIDRQVEIRAQFADYAEIACWLRSTWRKWLIKQNPEADRLRPGGDGQGQIQHVLIEDSESGALEPYNAPVPVWALRALQRGEPLYHVHLSPLVCTEIHDIIGWFDSLKGQSKFSRLNRVDYPTAARKAESWLDYRSEQVFDGPDHVGDTEPVCRFGDGYSIVRLLTKRALEREGVRMGHCVGELGHELSDGLEFLSLRDGRNRPHCTMEIDDQWLIAIAGKRNARLKDEYWEYVQEFFAQRYGRRLSADQVEECGSDCWIDLLEGGKVEMFDELDWGPLGWRARAALAWRNILDGSEGLNWLGRYYWKGAAILVGVGLNLLVAEPPP